MLVYSTGSWTYQSDETRHTKPVHVSPTVRRKYRPSRRLAFFPRDSEEIEFSVTGFAKHLTRVSYTLAIVIQYKTAGYARINDVQKVTRLKLQKAWRAILLKQHHSNVNMLLLQLNFSLSSSINSWKTYTIFCWDKCTPQKIIHSEDLYRGGHLRRRSFVGRHYYYYYYYYYYYQCTDLSDWMLVCWWWWFDWSFARLIAPVVTTTSVILCFNKHQLTQVHLV